MPSFNDPEAVAVPIKKQVLEKVQLNVAHRLGQAEMQALAQDIRLQVIEDTLTHSFITQLRTFLLGSNFHTVYLKETVEWHVPATWWDHFKASFFDKRPRLVKWLRPKIQINTHSQIVTKSEKVATHLCPHVAIASRDGDIVHLAWLDGRTDEAQAMRERLTCNGKLN